jgi:hypothetical protein
MDINNKSPLLEIAGVEAHAKLPTDSSLSTYVPASRAAAVVPSSISLALHRPPVQCMGGYSSPISNSVVGLVVATRPV